MAEAMRAMPPPAYNPKPHFCIDVPEPQNNLFIVGQCKIVHFFPKITPRLKMGQFSFSLPSITAGVQNDLLSNSFAKKIHARR